MSVEEPPAGAGRGGHVAPVAPPDAARRLQALERGAAPEEALRFVDSLPAVAVAHMIGSWRGAGLATGHPFDGLLERLGWHGKRFRSADDVDPLVFAGREGAFAVDPRFVPLGTVVRIAAAVRHPVVAASARVLLPLLRTSAPRARLRMVEHRGVVTATMCYDALPVNDHFRRVDDDTVVGVMDLRGAAQPFLFVLRREDSATA